MEKSFEIDPACAAPDQLSYQEKTAGADICVSVAAITFHSRAVSAASQLGVGQICHHSGCQRRRGGNAVEGSQGMVGGKIQHSE